MMNNKKTFLNGLFKENPTFVLLLGMCPTLAVTTGVIDAMGMGLSTAFVLICSNIFISLLRKYIPETVRIAAYVVIIASFVTIVEMFMKAYLPALSESLGMYIPLIVVNCIILGRAEAFASKNTIVSSIFDGLGMGLGFTGALMIIATFRELIGTGAFCGLPILGENFNGASIMIMAPGAFFTLGIILAVINIISAKKKGGDENAF